MSSGVIFWSASLAVMAAINVAAWSLSAAALGRRRAVLPAETYAGRRMQLLLSAVYVFGCAFRSVLPVFDVPRIVLLDSWLSSVIVGRSIATLAELCFVAQWALILREISRTTGSVVGELTARLVVPLIAIAEVCSWYSVLTTSNLGHVAEASLWGFSAALLVASMAGIGPRCDASWRPVILGLGAAAIAYVAFMFCVDVPMYWSRWVADEASGRHYLTITQGLLDVSARRVVSYRWEDWKHELAWMSLYFSVAVWISIWLIHAPVSKQQLASGVRKPLPSVPGLGIRTVAGRRT